MHYPLMLLVNLHKQKRPCLVFSQRIEPLERIKEAFPESPHDHGGDEQLPAAAAVGG